jgi:hypothetical protein
MDERRLKMQQAPAPDDGKREMAKFADLQLRLSSEQEARRKHYRTS